MLAPPHREPGDEVSEQHGGSLHRNFGTCGQEDAIDDRQSADECSDQHIGQSTDVLIRA